MNASTTQTVYMMMWHLIMVYVKTSSARDRCWNCVEWQLHFPPHDEAVVGAHPAEGLPGTGVSMASVDQVGQP